MRKTIFLVVLGLLLVGSIYVWWNYYNVVSDGYRDGDLQKFSRKGNVFKTHEGELVQRGIGTRNGQQNFGSDRFYFSVSDNAIADTLMRVQGNWVKVHYRQYRRSLPWRGDNYNDKNSENGQYIVDKVEEVRTVVY